MKSTYEDTICGIATASGRSAIGMIRVSGSDAIRICDGIFDGKNVSETWKPSLRLMVIS